VDWDRYDAALFDLDGVLTPTAEVHMRAWAATFSEVFRALGIGPRYDDGDYFTHVDGRPRYDAVRAVLASRGVTLPDGEPDDTSGTGTVSAIGNAKNDRFLELVGGGVAPYPDAVVLLDRLAGLRLPCAVVSSSRNARPVLDAAGLTARFGVVVDGLVARREGLAGKPSPQTFLHAAAALGVSPERAVVLEDAVSGVAAGAAGGFGMVVGVDRGAGVEALGRAGAGRVVEDLTELVGP
jgi:HAD superfamily hydrolase (TIGR01509 family)